MMLAKTGGPDFDARIHRAKHLGAVHSFSAEIMQFYEHLVQFQKSLYSQLAQPGIRHPVPASARDFRSNLDVAALLQNFPMFLSLLQNIGTPPITTRQDPGPRLSSGPWRLKPPETSPAP
jgi:hypothetical protein